MRNNRVVIVAGMIGIAIVAVTYVGASRLSGDEKGAKEGHKALSPVKSGSRGVVVFGTADVDNGAGLLAVFPDCFPQPCKVRKVHVVEGQPVELGDPLIDFDSELADSKVAQARAGLEQAQAALQGANAMVDHAALADKMHLIAVEAQGILLKSKEAELEAANIDLKDKRRRFGAVNAGMDPELLAAEKKFEAAQKALDTEKKKLEALALGNPNPFSMPKPRAVAAVAEAKAAVAVQEAKLNEALYGKKLMTLKAPAAGKIVRASAAEGMTYGAQTRVPAFLIQTKGPIVVRAEVDQEFAARVAKGQDAIITDDGDPNMRWNGKVLRVADSFLPKRGNMAPEGLMLNDTRVLECIVSIDVGASGVPVRVGQRVKVSIGVE